MDLSEKLIEVEELNALGNSNEAIRILLEIIKALVAEDQFGEAEILRQRILAIDDMAISEIVEASEIIENARASLVPESVMDSWSDFRNHFTEDEFNDLFYSTHIQNFDANKIIYKQGCRNDFLYFINKGTVKSVFAKEDADILVQTLGPGEMFGHESLFSLSLSPTTMQTNIPVNIGLLSDFAIQKLMEKHPGILSKLKSYGQTLVSSQDILQKRGLTRRSHERFKIDRKRLSFTILDPSGKPLTREHAGEFSDISVGGLSFFIRMKNNDYLKKLLGKNIIVKSEFSKEKGCFPLEKTGVITGMIAKMFNEYSLHVKFDDHMENLLDLVWNWS